MEVPSCFVGLILENCQLPFANHGHVILADPSPILFYPISSTEVRCLVDLPGQKLPSLSNGEMANYLKNMVAPQVSVIILLDMWILQLQFFVTYSLIFACLNLRGKFSNCFSLHLPVSLVLIFVRFYLSFMMLSYLLSIKEILEQCLTKACQLTPVLLLEPC